MSNILLTFLLSIYLKCNEKNKVNWGKYFYESKFTCNYALYFWKKTYIMKHLETLAIFSKDSQKYSNIAKILSWCNPPCLFQVRLFPSSTSSISPLERPFPLSSASFLWSAAYITGGDLVRNKSEGVGAPFPRNKTRWKSDTLRQIPRATPLIVCCS